MSDLSDAFNDGLATPNDNKVEWVQKTGKIVFHLATTKTFKAGEEYVISVEKLLNSNEAQDSPDVTVKLTGEVEVATVPMEKGMGEMAPFYISPPKLLVAKIGQSSCTLGASNTLTISLESNIGIQAIGAGSAAKVTISGLTVLRTRTPTLPLPPLATTRPMGSSLATRLPGRKTMAPSS